MRAIAPPSSTTTAPERSAPRPVVGTGLMFHHVALLTERGLTPAQAAANFVPQTIAGAVAALVAGRLADQLPARALLAASTSALAAAPLVLLGAGPGPSAVLYGVVLGSAASSIRAIEATVLPRWFGTDHIGELRGIVMAASVGASAAGPIALTVAADNLGGHRPALQLFAASAAALAVLCALLRPPHHVRSHP